MLRSWQRSMHFQERVSYVHYRIRVKSYLRQVISGHSPRLTYACNRRQGGNASQYDSSIRIICFCHRWIQVYLVFEYCLEELSAHKSKARLFAYRRTRRNKSQHFDPSVGQCGTCGDRSRRYASFNTVVFDNGYKDVDG